MCGIAGIIRRQQEVTSRELSRMSEALSHRGPDDSGYWLEGPVGLAHTRLSIIDLAGGHQPLRSRDGRLHLIANGEIYNYLELREELVKKGCEFSTRSDSETILQAYAVYGNDFLRHLHGMFAFCLYDKSENKMILARDRLGIKPLFYAPGSDQLVFGSEIKAILPILRQNPAVEPQALIQFLQSQFNTGENTIISGIRRIPPGHGLWVDGDLKTDLRPYWSVREVKTRKRSFEEASHEFEGLMETVMREHLRSDVPYGLFLSGGVDSAVLLAMLDRFQENPVRTFSVGYPGAKMKDELNEAEFIARRFRTVHTPVELDQEKLFRRIPYSIWAADDLMRDYANLPTSILAERAGRELKVVFSGEGGDEVFAGYRRYRRTLFERFIKNLLSPGSGGFRTRGQLQPKWAGRLFADSLKKVRHKVREPFVKTWQETNPSWSSIQKGQYTDLVTALPDNLLVKADRMLMSFGVEGRVPFLDHRVVEFGLSLPDDLKIQAKQGKVFLKRWAEQFIPREHLYQRKRGFYVPVGEWLKGKFVDQLEGKLIQNRAISEWFQVDGVRALFAAKRRGRNVNREIWSLMQFAIWQRMFIERSASRPAPDEDPLDWIG